tara:strand:+ start:65 stop:196 length:132 start_codon:yes stop_codon:yes gene_type:complete
MTKQKAIEILSNLITAYVDSVDIDKKEIRKLDKALEILIKEIN